VRPPQRTAWDTVKLLPHWTVSQWLVGLLMILVLGIVEKSFRFTRDIEADLETAKARVAEFTKSPRLRVLGGCGVGAP
jgi:hypothetical protein